MKTRSRLRGPIGSHPAIRPGGSKTGAARILKTATGQMISPSMKMPIRKIGKSTLKALDILWIWRFDYGGK
jgi:hypothetical protein